ncbi:MAG: hypothetical protein EOO28_05805 [Comamonadaceae bacterium]|nr:MAG: hypothetical protein EOO28_05805 [Comamonadaceae bacterium]
MKLAGIFLGSAVAFAAQAVHAVQDCDIAGQSVNPNNGYTTAGKTGLMRCKDRDTGQLQREQELQNGKFMGLVRFYEDGKLAKEHSVNEKGNRNGRAREFTPDGTVLRDATYDNGGELGLVRSFYPSGKLRRVSFQAQPGGEQAYAEFNERGQLSALRCGEKPLLAPAADDARLCGFGGASAASPSRIELFDDRGTLSARSSYLAGQRVRHESLHASGQPNYQDEISGSTRVQRYFNTSGEKRREAQLQLQPNGKSWATEREQDFAPNGTLTRDRRWSAGKAVSEETFYLNGQPRSKVEYGVAGSGGNSNNGSPALQKTTDYYDSGRVASIEFYSNVNRMRQIPVGTHQRYSESGKLVSESIYDDRGRIAREKSWDESGKLLRDDEVFEDGSRKAFAK